MVNNREHVTITIVPFFVESKLFEVYLEPIHYSQGEDRLESWLFPSSLTLITIIIIFKNILSSILYASEADTNITFVAEISYHMLSYSRMLLLN
jgi:hypothetical protein